MSQIHHNGICLPIPTVEKRLNEMNMCKFANSYPVYL